MKESTRDTKTEQWSILIFEEHPSMTCIKMYKRAGLIKTKVSTQNLFIVLWTSLFFFTQR